MHHGVLTSMHSRMACTVLAQACHHDVTSHHTSMLLVGTLIGSTHANTHSHVKASGPSVVRHNNQHYVSKHWLGSLIRDCGSNLYVGVEMF